MDKPIIAGKLTLKRLAEELAKLVRDVAGIKKEVSLLATDERNILENILGRLAAIEEQMSITRQHDNTVRKDIKEEVQIASDRTVAKVEVAMEKTQEAVEDIQKTIQNKKVVEVKKKFKWFWQK